VPNKNGKRINSLYGGQWSYVEFMDCCTSASIVFNPPYTEYPFRIHPSMIIPGIAKTKVRTIRHAPLPLEHVPKTRKNVCLLKMKVAANISNTSRNGTSLNFFNDIQSINNRGYLGLLALPLKRMSGKRSLQIKIWKVFSTGMKITVDHEGYNLIISSIQPHTFGRYSSKYF
jgi:hypothetical protein